MWDILWKFFGSIFRPFADKWSKGILWQLLPRTPTAPSTASTPATASSDDASRKEMDGIIQPIGRKEAKRNVKVVAEDPMLEVMTKELFILGDDQRVAYLRDNKGKGQ